MKNGCEYAEAFGSSYLSQSHRLLPEQVAFFLRQLDIMADLNSEEIEELSSVAIQKEYQAGQVIVREGSKTDAIYLIYKGIVEVFKNPKGCRDPVFLHTIKAGSYFGEMSYIDGSPSLETIRARTAVTVLILSRDLLGSHLLSRNLYTSITRTVLDRFRRVSELYASSLHISALEHSDVLTNLDKEEIGQLRGLLEEKTYAAGDIIVAEGDNQPALYFIVKGSVEILKTVDNASPSVIIGHVRENDYIGELSFVDRMPSSETCRAQTDTTVLILKRSKLEPSLLYQKIIGSINKKVISRLRSTSDSYARSLLQRLHESKLRADFGRLYIITTIIFGMYTLLPTNYSQYPPYVQLGVSWGMLIAMLLPFLYFLKAQGSPLNAFGLTSTGLKQSIIEGLFFLFALTPFFILIKKILYPHAPLITWGSLANYTRMEFTLFMVSYIFHTFIQEFICRGIVQTSLARFLAGSHFIKPIVIVSMVFGIFHLYASISFGLLTFIASMILGLVFYRHRNIGGVFIIHYGMGILCFAFGLN